MKTIVFVNGRFVPEEEAVISVFDRGFLYGDGLFETMRVRNGRPFRWTDHMERLAQGLAHLQIKLPCAADQLLGFALELIRRNAMPDSIMRLTISRGVGLRGYSPKGADQPTVTLSLHPAPAHESGASPAWKLVTASIRLPTHTPLARLKTCNKLPQILARAEADDAGADEALLLNTDGHVVEGASSNLFWIEGTTLYTPPIEHSGILPGVTRETVCQLAREGLPPLPHSLSVREKSVEPEALMKAEAIFVSLSTVGIAEAVELNGQRLPRHPIIASLFVAYHEALDRETSSESTER